MSHNHEYFSTEELNMGSDGCHQFTTKRQKQENAMYGLEIEEVLEILGKVTSPYKHLKDDLREMVEHFICIFYPENNASMSEKKMEKFKAFLLDNREKIKKREDMSAVVYTLFNLYLILEKKGN